MVEPPVQPTTQILPTFQREVIDAVSRDRHVEQALIEERSHVSEVLLAMRHELPYRQVVLLEEEGASWEAAAAAP